MKKFKRCVKILQISTHIRRVRNLSVDDFRVDREQHAQEEVDRFRSSSERRQQIGDEGRPARRKVGDESKREELRCFVAKVTGRAGRVLAL